MTIDKPIIHFQIPLSPQTSGKYYPQDDLAISNAALKMFLQLVKDEIGDQAHIIATPFDISVFGVKAENVELDEITLKEFLGKCGLEDTGEV